MNNTDRKLPERGPIRILKHQNRLAVVLICYHCGQPMLGKWRYLWFGNTTGKSCDAYFMHYECQEPFRAEHPYKGLWFCRGRPALGYITWPTDKELAKREAPKKHVYVVRESFGTRKVISITKSYLRATKKQHLWSWIHQYSIAALEDGAIEGDPYVEKWLALRRKKIQEIRRRKK